jgi:hypothetical protein
MATEWPAVCCLGWPCWVNREIVLETNTCGRKGESGVGTGDGSANWLVLGTVRLTGWYWGRFG